MTMPVEDEFTELVDADIPRVDLVQGAANGTRFLIAKREGGAGLLDADYVRELIGKSEPEPEQAGETVTMTGSPAAMAKMIHQAAQRYAMTPAEVDTQPAYFAEVTEFTELAKAKYNADDRKRMAGTGAAMDDGSYPIADREDLTRAVRAVGRGGAGHDAIRRHIISRAKSLGASAEIPDNWNSDGSLKEGSVSKMELDESTDGMDPTVVLAAPDQEAPGDPMDPGSPAWEAIDAATAQKWTSILARAKAAIDVLAQREMLEAASASGDCDDADNAMDLEDACCAIDYAISVLAPFAVSEQSESDMGADMMAAVGKALAGWDPAPLDTIEALSQVRKAGRVLSSANESAIRGAVDSLQKVLASLPQAPTVPDGSGQPVAKEEKTVTATTLEPDTAPVEKTDADATAPESASTGQAPVEKADGETKPEAVAVYDKNGNLVGICDPVDITPIAGAKAEEPADDKSEAASAVEVAPDPADLAPAPAAEVGTPADDVGKSADTSTNTDPTDTSDAVFKSIAADVVTAALADYSATQEQAVAKQADALAHLADVVETLKGQIQALEEQPAPPKVFTNGAVPPAHLLRGQDTGAVSVDMAKAAELRKGLSSPDAGEQNRAALNMQEMAIARLEAIHQGRASR